MCDIASEVRALGAAGIVIGNGQPWQAAAARSAAGIPFPVFVDPSRRSYRAAGLHRGGWRVLDPRVFLAARRAHRNGARQTTVQGDPWQLGGTLVFDRAGNLTYRHVSRFPGDHAEPATIQRALRSL